MKNLVAVAAVSGWLILLAAIGWLGATVHQVEVEVKTVRENVRHLGYEANDAVVDMNVAVQQTDLHSINEAKSLIAELSEAATAENIATTLVTLDSWFVMPEEQAEFQTLKSDLVLRLRKSAKQEIDVLQKSALASPNSSEGSKKHAEAGRVLVLYPMSDEPAVIDEAKQLAVRQGEVAVRLEALRRQRYNRWSTERIEAAINGYNANKSYTSPKAENPRLIASLVSELKQVDPALLEPAVLELYNYVVDLTKSSISETDRVDLAKLLTDPATERKTLGDF